MLEDLKRLRDWFVMKHRGSVLVFILWILSLLAIFSIAVGFTVSQRLNAIGRLATREDLRDVAEAGVLAAIEVLESGRKTESFSDALKDSWSVNPERFREIGIGRGSFNVSYEVPGGTYHGMTDEESKINLNLVGDSEVLVRLFSQAVLAGGTDARVIASSILDWIDPDEEEREGGAESSYYQQLKQPYRSKNGRLDALEELLLIKGMTMEALNSIRPYVTLWNSGKINLNTASSIVLNALGLEPNLAGKIIFYRAGQDGVERTNDDRSFKDIETIPETLETVYRLTDVEKTSLLQLLSQGIASVRSEFFHIRSVAQLGRRPGFLTIWCIVDEQGKARFWHETFSV